jgi:hypothetical protein
MIFLDAQKLKNEETILKENHFFQVKGMRRIEKTQILQEIPENR